MTSIDEFFEISDKSGFYILILGKHLEGNYKGIEILDISNIEKILKYT